MFVCIANRILQMLELDTNLVTGPLVRAMRQGHWVILDELNLAPPEILEALNRVSEMTCALNCML